MAWIVIVIGALSIFLATRLGRKTASNNRTIGESTAGQVAGSSFKIIGKIWLYLFGAIFVIGGLIFL